MPFGLSLSKTEWNQCHSWFDKLVLSDAEGLTTSG